MFVSESIYFLILFTLPAAFHIIYNVHVRFVPVIKKDKSVEIAECIAFCTVVFFVNMIIVRSDLLKLAQYLLTDDSAKVDYCIKNNFEYISFMIHYFIVNLISSIAVIALWYSLGQMAFRKARNFINKKVGRDEEKKFNDVWRTLFETEEYVDASNCIVKIEKGGQLVTAGLIQLYPAPTEENKELALYNTDSIKQLFEWDKNKEVKDKIFPYSISEYYDIGNDVLIKFYDAERYDNYYENEPE